MIRTEARRAGVVLIAAGLLALLGADIGWAECSTTGCDGFLQAFSTQTGTEFGHGVVSGLAGGALSLVGIRVHHAAAARIPRVVATALSAIILIVVVVFVVGVYALNDARDEPLHLYGLPELGLYATAVGGSLGLVTASRLPTEPRGRSRGSSMDDGRS